MKRTFIAGQRFGQLTFLRLCGSNRFNQRQAVFECTCGKRKRMGLSHVTTGWLKSCGCAARNHAKSLHAKINPRTGLPLAVHYTRFETVVITQMMRYYIDGARKRGLTFKLTRPQFIKLVYGNCHYCGRPPHHARVARHESAVHHGRFVLVNGIDRKRNSVGYLPGNSVTSCMACNYGKHKMTEAEYFAHCKRVVAHMEAHHDKRP